MSELNLSNLLGSGKGHLQFELFTKSDSMLEGLRRGLLALSRLETHPFFHQPPSKQVLRQVRNCFRDLKEYGLDRLVVAGIGGSSLGGRVLCKSVETKVRFLESVDPSDTMSVLSSTDWRRTALNVISKSGGTLETLVNASLALRDLKKELPSDWKKHVVVTSSPGDGQLQRWANEEGIPTLEIPEAVGGRYSVLTPVGLLPAAFDGRDLSQLVLGAKRGADKSLLLHGIENPALSLAFILVHYFIQGVREVDLWGYGRMPYLFARWVQQLWGESLGRRVGDSDTHRVGVTPLACTGSADQHSLLQLFVDGPPTRWVLFLTEEPDGIQLTESEQVFCGLPNGAGNTGMIQEALWQGTARVLEEAGTPVVRFHMGTGSAADVGEAFFIFQAATIYAAELMEIDPFGQPGVEAGKRYTRDFIHEAAKKSR